MYNNTLKTPIILLILALFFSCNYRYSDSTNPDKKLTVSIPYVQGDYDGTLTSQLVETLQNAGGFQYVNEGGDLLLHVKVLERKSDDIGFRYEPKRYTKGVKKLIPDETRRKILAEVTVINANTQSTLLGPVYILGSCDFDHQNYSQDNDINVFSLGQLADIDTAYDVVSIPLYRNLAQEIAQYLQNHYVQCETVDSETTPPL